MRGIMLAFRPVNNDGKFSIFNMQSTLANQPEILSTLPSLPPATALPWSAEIIQAQCGLVSAFGISYRALNLDESDPFALATISNRPKHS